MSADIPVVYDVNEVVWAQTGRHPWWPAYVLQQTPNTSSSRRSWEVVFGYNNDGDGVGVKNARIPEQQIVKFTSRAQSNELNGDGGNGDDDDAGAAAAAAAAQKKKKKTRKQLKVEEQLNLAIQRAEQDVVVWQRSKDRSRRVCLCRMLYDDQRPMIRCPDCDECRVHPECVGITTTATATATATSNHTAVGEQKASSLEIDPPADYSCPLTDVCETCRERIEEEKRQARLKRKRLAAAKKAAKLAATAAVAANASSSNPDDSDGEDIRALWKKQRIREDPDETETDTSSSEDLEFNPDNAPFI